MRNVKGLSEGLVIADAGGRILMLNEAPRRRKSASNPWK
jgi:hypothetical protein